LQVSGAAYKFMVTRAARSAPVTVGHYSRSGPRYPRSEAAPSA